MSIRSSPLPPRGGGDRGGGSRELWALAALALILAITVGWWAAALWPLPAAAPDWVVRARVACFGSTASGLPDSGGWILLVGTPLTMVGALLIIAGGSVRAGLRSLATRRLGGVALGTLAALLVLLAGAAGVRVLEAAGRLPGAGDAELLAAAELPEPVRLDRPAPPLALLDQHGETVTLERFRGRPVLVTFAYGKCETVCPVIVQSARSAQEQLAELEAVLLVVTLDPWRDTPARLPHIAASWQLGADGHLLGGEVDEVEATLDGWEVPRVRDPRTGEIAHPSLVYLVDRNGVLAFAVSGNAEQIAKAVRRL